MRFLVDAQLPPALARRIAAAGHVCEHVADCGLLSALDPAIRAYATDVGAIIITKDEDFAVHLLLHGGPSVVWLRVGNTCGSRIANSRADSRIGQRCVARGVWPTLTHA